MNLKENAVLMRLSIGMPGEQRQDRQLTEEVKSQHSLGARAGKWEKFLYPPEALKPIKELDTKARTYHNSVTLPFDSGVGILPAALIMEYSDRMREFASQRAHLVDSHFVPKYPDFIEWARREHNGSFDASLYPPIEELKSSFYFRTEPLPVPDGAHFASTVSSLLGTDTETVNQRVAEAAKEAQRELLSRMIKPVRHMAQTLSKEDPRIFDSLIGNIQEIAKLAPALNLAGDPVIDAFAKELRGLSQFRADELRRSNTEKKQAAAQAAAVLSKLSAYKL